MKGNISVIAVLLWWFRGLACGQYQENKLSIDRSQESSICKFCTQLAQNCSYLQSKFAWPFLNETSPKAIEIKATFYPDRFLGINDLDQTFSMRGKFTFQWYMPSCASWSAPEDCRDSFPLMQCNTPALCVFDSEQMWRPTIEHTNSFSEESPFNREGGQLAVFQMGLAHWEVLGRFESTCPLTLKRFPFDQQTCSIDIAMRYFWDRTLVEFKPELGYYADPFAEGDIWQVMQSQVGVNSVENVLRFQFAIRRKSEPYVGTIFISMGALVTMQLSVFLMPAEMPDRAGLSMTAFLASTVLFGVINDETPKTPEVMHVVKLFATQTILGVAITTYTLVACRLANTRKHFFKRRLNLTKRCGMTLIDFIDIIVFGIVFSLHFIAAILLFILMAY